MARDLAPAQRPGTEGRPGHQEREGGNGDGNRSEGGDGNENKNGHGYEGRGGGGNRSANIDENGEEGGGEKGPVNLRSDNCGR